MKADSTPRPSSIETWAPTGVTPILTHPYNWTSISAISIITTTGDLYFRLHPGKTIRSGDVLQFLHHLLRQIQGDIVLYWDGLPAHRSAKVKRFLAKNPRLRIERLPSYSPDLNPDEAVWNYVKTKQLANLSVKHTSELLHKIRGSLRALQHRPHLIKSFLFESELPWNPEVRQCIVQSL